MGGLFFENTKLSELRKLRELSLPAEGWRVELARGRLCKVKYKPPKTSINLPKLL
jgi:hypothetical protein